MPESIAKSKPSVWILEDDAGVLSMYQDILVDNYSLVFFSTLASFQVALRENGNRLPNLMIADVRMRDGSFLNFLSERKLHQEDAVLMVSSVDDIDVIRECFSKGVRDYLVKPLKRTELVVKMEQILKTGPRHSEPRAASALPFDFSIDQVTMQVHFGEMLSTTLTSKEFQMLSIFKGASEYRMSRDDLLQLIWKGMRVSAKTLDVHLFNLRRKIQPLGLFIEFEAPCYYRVVSRS